MKRMPLIVIAALSACSTTGEKLSSMTVRSTAQTSQSPQAIANCIVNRTPGLYSPVITQEGDATVVSWRQEPIGHVASFTIKPIGGKASVEVRSVAPIRKQIAKVEGCYGA